MLEYVSPIFTIFDDIDLVSIAGDEGCTNSVGSCCITGKVAFTCIAAADAGESCHGDSGVGAYCDSSRTSGKCINMTGVDCVDGAEGKLVQV